MVTCVGSLARGSLPGEMKKVLHSFLSLVTSRISFVMLTILPATGGTRRKSRILAGKGRGEGLTSVPRPALGWCGMKTPFSAFQGGVPHPLDSGN